MRKAFTLIELIISIVILTIIMIFLYKSYAAINKSNILLSNEVQKISQVELLKEVIFKDFSVAISSETNTSIVTILNQSKREDVVFLQTSNSIHKRINPYVAYVVNDKRLYRLESLKPFREYPLVLDSEFVVDELGKVKSFRVYKSKDTIKGTYLFHALFEDSQEILLKVSAF
ncbi:prepilin-type N-terminal cleavage/methylation domain-containing protein [Sulfurimonas sp. SAG-AH-194-C21]|nr:prepilin-type N-terminal cleavage/methylation domain-containing protein [Sulfurimonas sp. SAG-AH-194-C21]MDF1883046.1 prepilin-type N-terminal cleavage/methylation domain-containing protein [Sulfurimonas sp. SAG-AH-194-C21]